MFQCRPSLGRLRFPSCTALPVHRLLGGSPVTEHSGGPRSLENKVHGDHMHLTPASSKPGVLTFQLPTLLLLELPFPQL